MSAKPVKRKLVLHPKDWPWSRRSYYEKGEEGMIRIDLLDEQKDKGKNLGKNPKNQTPHP
jgi:hypothetical protein